MTEIIDSLLNGGGGRGIRTLETVTRLHAFQACAFSHSATSPALLKTGETLDWLKTSARATLESHMACAICSGRLQPLGHLSCTALASSFDANIACKRRAQASAGPVSPLSI